MKSGTLATRRLQKPALPGASSMRLFEVDIGSLALLLSCRCDSAHSSKLRNHSIEECCVYSLTSESNHCEEVAFVSSVQKRLDKIILIGVNEVILFCQRSISIYGLLTCNFCDDMSLRCTRSSE